MTSEKAREMTELLVTQMGIPGYTWAVLLVVGSAVGGFFGAYLKRRAENLATKDDFDEIKRQLEETTRVAEEVKRSINDRGWIAQQRWARKEEHYIALVRVLTEYEHSVLLLERSINKYGCAEPEVIDRYTDAATGVHASYAIARLFVQDSTSDTLLQLILMSGNGISGVKNMDLVTLTQRGSMAARVRDAVIAQAKADLAVLDGSTPV